VDVELSVDQLDRLGRCIWLETQRLSFEQYGEPVRITPWEVLTDQITRDNCFRLAKAVVQEITDNKVSWYDALGMAPLSSD
jgi:hypothetical protein